MATKIICISGKAGSGKDTIGQLLKMDLEDKGYDVLVAHFADLTKYVCKMFFGWNGEKDEDGRSLLQRVGTEQVRAYVPDYWVAFICDMLFLFPDEWDYVIIPDCRFPNEFEYFIGNGFDATLVRIERPDFDNGLTDEQKSHKSETAMDEYPADYLVVNDANLIALAGKATVLSKCIRGEA